MSARKLENDKNNWGSNYIFSIFLENVTKNGALSTRKELRNKVLNILYWHRVLLEEIDILL